MNSSNCRVRRATLDDMSALKALWESMRFSDPDLERRLTEFQVAVSQDGELLGALGLQINAKHGRMHSEAFTDFALAEQLRPLLWERIQSIATSHGLVRLWTQERAPFWSRCGLMPADAKALEKLPPAWASEPTGWLTAQLRDETAILVSLDKEFALFMESEKQRTQSVMRHAKTLKIIATIVAVILAVFVGVAALRLFHQHPELLNR